jgi:hypothetical protein
VCPTKYWGNLEFAALWTMDNARLSTVEPNSNTMSAFHELALMALLRILLYG